MKILAVINKKLFLSLCFFYFFIRFLFLLRLPIFNDESIYLDWGWKELHSAGLFYSLYDAKQPFLMWIFGIFEIIFPDPLFAGRFVSVCCGFATMIGLYKLGETVWGRQTAYFTSLLYIATPIFSFFDRQALMESAITAIGVWTCYGILKFMQSLTTKNAIFIGVLLGIGEFIKSTALMFTITTLLIIGFLFLRYRDKQTVIKFFGIILLTMLCVDFLLLIQPEFWTTLSTNDRFTLSFTELLQFPVMHWLTNFSSDSIISFFYITPLVLLLGLFGIGIILRNKKRKELICVVWFMSSLLLQMLVTRDVSQRYLVSFLPLLLLFAGYVLATYVKKWKYIVFCAIAIIPLAMTCTEVITPVAYITTLAKIQPFAQPEYVEGYTSGYGLNLVRTFIEKQAQQQPIFVGVAENAGNPESALFTYYEKNPSVTVTYFDHQMIGSALDQYDCIILQRPMVFVSRDEQQGGYNKFLMKLTTIHNPYGVNTLGIYTLKRPCRGKVANMQVTAQQ